MEIEKFDPRPRCPKCLQDRWHRIWREGDPKHGGAGAHFVSGLPEHLSLACEACGYSFLMQPADQAGYDAKRQ